VNSRPLVFGAGGQVGSALLQLGTGHVIGLRHLDVDICDQKSVAEAVRRYSPTSLINAAAFTQVDRAESEAAQAFRVNRDGATIVALVASIVDVPLLHLSTDYVFDGNKRAPYLETDAVAPVNTYGRSKEEGERGVRERCRKHVLLRSSWVYSPSGTNFVRAMLRLGSQRSELGVVNDQLGCPTAATDIAAAILKIVAAIERRQFTEWGTYHYAGADAVTWYGFAKTIFAKRRAIGKPTPKLFPITTADYPTPARRPPYSVLSTEKVRQTFAIKPCPLSDSLDECLTQLSDAP
jgi:dTDP-4-dehydrorhamnose reductase